MPSAILEKFLRGMKSESSTGGSPARISLRKSLAADEIKLHGGYLSDFWLFELCTVPKAHNSERNPVDGVCKTRTDYDAVVSTSHSRCPLPSDRA